MSERDRFKRKRDTRGADVSAHHVSKYDITVPSYLRSAFFRSRYFHHMKRHFPGVAAQKARTRVSLCPHFRFPCPPRYLILTLGFSRHIPSHPRSAMRPCHHLQAFKIRAIITFTLHLSLFIPSSSSFTKIPCIACALHKMSARGRQMFEAASMLSAFLSDSGIPHAFYGGITCLALGSQHDTEVCQ